jgi:Domain of unknown function (DUF5753)/Helix-turn-helix domain
VTTASGVATVERGVLGARLRRLPRLRQARGLACQRAARAIRGSGSKISRMELGQLPIRDQDIDDLLTCYNVEDPVERTSFLAMAGRTNVPAGYAEYGDVVQKSFQQLLALEAIASRIHTYEVQFIPCLLQTEDYARAVDHAACTTRTQAQVDRWVHVRLTRQERLTCPDPPPLWAVIDEVALLRPMGGVAVMRAQLEHLLDMRERKNIVLQIMPLRFGGHAADRGAFSLLRFQRIRVVRTGLCRA